MSNQNTIIRFEKVSFSFAHDKQILNEVSFSVRNGMKVALMGQNGAGKSTILKLITKNCDLTQEKSQLTKV